MPAPSPNPPTPAAIALHCRVSRGRLTAVSLVPRRPPPVERLAAGRTPAEAVALFASLFSLCPEAHCGAASTALAAAMSLAVPPARRELCEARRELEIVKEHTLNILLQRQSAAPEPLRILLGVHQALRAATGGWDIYGPSGRVPELDVAVVQGGLDAWNRLLYDLCGDFWNLDEPDLAAVQRWQGEIDSPAARLLHHHARPEWAEFGRCDASLLPALPFADLEAWLNGPPDRLATPVWEDQPRETGCYARQAETPLIRAARAEYGNGLYTRVLARLVEIKRLFHSARSRLTAGWTSGPSEPEPGQGTGLAQTEASRGRLIHHAEVADGRIRAYRILAPTEWNFHPHGLLPAALTGAPAGADLPAQIDALLRAVDPCVDFRVTLDHA